MPSVPTAIGPFHIERELGRGGMGVVYLARDTRLDREVAIKALPEHLVDDPDRLARFQREAKTLASLNHPGIAAIYGLESHEKHQYLVLEYVEGETLAEVLTRGPIPTDEALGIAKQIAEALEVAHEKGVIHRDIKPGNVIITPEGNAKVLDFGLARTAEGSPSSSAAGVNNDSPTLTTPHHPVHSPTIPGAIMGTAGYMSPEQARGKPVDKRSDIFSFGCVLCEMLTGARPFTGETVADALGATLHKEPNLGMLPPSTPPRMRELLTNCLAKDRKNRLHDIGDARIEIDRAIAGREWATPSTVENPLSRAKGVAWGIACALALLVLGALIWSTLGPRDRDDVEPVCVSVAMPPDVEVQTMAISRDGKMFIGVGTPKDSEDSSTPRARIYTRRLDSYEFEALKGTEGVFWMQPTADSRSARFAAPVSPGAIESRSSIVPLDGSTPPTTFVEWNPTWRGTIELENGGLVVQEGDRSFVGISPDGRTISAPVRMDADRPGIQRFEFTGKALPGDRAALINVVSYGSRGFQFSVGVLDPTTGRVRVIVEDGGNAVYAPTGHIVLSRGDVILAAPFDPSTAEIRGVPVAVWSGLSTFNRAFPGFFQIANDGTLCYPIREGAHDGAIGILSADGDVQTWSAEHTGLSNAPSVSPDGRTVIFQILNARGIDQLWISPTDHADLRPLSTEANADSFYAAWSPDSKRVAYLRFSKDARDGVYIRDVDTGVERRLWAVTKEDDAIFPHAWLRDGSALLCTRVLGGKPSIVVVPAGDAETDPASIRPFLPSEFNRFAPHPSPDGRFVAFIGEDSGVGNVWVAEMQPDGRTSRPIQVRTARVEWFAWARDGTSLYLSDERRRLMKATVTPGPPLSISTPAEIADLEALGIQRWAPLADGRFLVGLEGEGEGGIVRCNMVLNWTEILKKKVPTDK